MFLQKATKRLFTHLVITQFRQIFTREIVSHNFFRMTQKIVQLNELKIKQSNNVVWRFLNYVCRLKYILIKTLNFVKQIKYNFIYQHEELFLK